MLKTDNVIPLYQQLADRIREQIIMEVYKPGDRLPSERELAREYKVSVITSRKALAELEDEGLVERVQGKGTFVSIKKYNRNLNKFISFTEMCESIGAKAGAKEIEKEIIIPNKKIADKLEIPADSQAVYISRLRFVDSNPMVIEKSYFNLDYAYLLNQDLSKSLFKILKNKSEFLVIDSDKTIEIVRSNLEESNLLNIPIDSPIILIESRTYLKDGEIGYVGKQLINGERFKLII